MRILIYILLILSVISIGVNIYLIDFSNSLEGRSFIALISAGIALIAFLLLLIFLVAKRIRK
ncbi:MULTISPECIES: hypothetical protein [Capnocytophaga]|uniref:hypothetical protein n=1 Tax=Capnocytophaga TaxID=1016 RepID=UPI0005A799E1|nr:MULTISPECIES: hypothetical protein [Capnocytophaga]ATA73662.1 hypothetical protein CGC49_10495 [Capnocytophaga sp. H4358]